MSIRVEGFPPADAHVAVSTAFREIELVHRLMSFHELESDVGRMNRQAYGANVEVHPYTVEVLKHAIEISAATDGCFDVAVAAEVVEWGWLPRPKSVADVPVGTWRDIELTSTHSVRLRRPLWIDLGGIAKGYAVDRAANCLRDQGVMHAVINAGGDIRVLGREPEQIALGLGNSANAMPVVELSDGSIASSSSHDQHRPGTRHSAHVDGLDRSPAHANRFVCVLAEQCVIADALTKVVMAKGACSEAVLEQFGATAHLLDAHTGWQSLNSGMVCQ